MKSNLFSSAIRNVSAVSSRTIRKHARRIRGKSVDFVHGISRAVSAPVFRSRLIVTCCGTHAARGSCDRHRKRKPRSSDERSPAKAVNNSGRDFPAATRISLISSGSERRCRLRVRCGKRLGRGGHFVWLKQGDWKHQSMSASLIGR